jgi:PhoPQ-activated pathogenicity-related protein
MKWLRSFRLLFCIFLLAPLAVVAQSAPPKTTPLKTGLQPAAPRVGAAQMAMPRLSASPQTELDRYVHAPDSHYRYTLEDTEHNTGYTVYVIRMISQQWRTAADVNQPVWKHWMEIYVPDQVTSPVGLLYITGGATSEDHPKPDQAMVEIATLTHTVACELYDVPNQPLTFTNDPYGPRKEDEMIAYTWRKFMETGDASWPARLPMTKTAVRAMDTVTSFAASAEGGSHRVDRFVVMGASKRGWTTWTTAAVDPRVIAIAPMVIDLLNVVPSFEHHYRSYGFWAPSVGNYYAEHLMDQIDDTGFKKLMDEVDPYSYRARYTMPKLIITASGDQFFLPDSSQFYFKDLPGEKHMLTEANADHSLKGTDVIQSIAAFYQSVVDGTKRPEMHWTLEADGAIRVTMDRTPLTVKLWQATNPKHRDFRVEAIGHAYTATDLKPESTNVYVARVPKPAQGWTAYYVEATFAGDGKYPFKFTSGVRVTPDTEPFTMAPKGKSKLQPEAEAARY